MKSISDISKTLEARIGKILWILGLRAFLLILLFILLDFIIGGFVFYKYVFLAEEEMPGISGSIIKFDDKTYQNVLQELQAKENSNVELPVVNSAGS